MNTPLFITGIGTGVGKTVVSAIVTRALGADYWKPIQAGFEEGTDSGFVRSVLSNESEVFPELYTLKLPASPHIAAREENLSISIEAIKQRMHEINERQKTGTQLIIEGAGGLLVPLNDHAFVADLIKQLQARVVLVSRNYLGSINHSLLTAEVCRSYKLDVLGWIFNDQYMAYEDEIANWSGFPKIGTIPFAKQVNEKFVEEQSLLLAPSLKKIV